jgi:hypothetical protein
MEVLQNTLNGVMNAVFSSSSFARLSDDSQISNLGRRA